MTLPPPRRVAWVEWCRDAAGEGHLLVGIGRDEGEALRGACEASGRAPCLVVADGEWFVEGADGWRRGK